MPRNIKSVREWSKKKKKLGGLSLYREASLPGDPTRRIKDPTAHFAFKKDKDASGAYGSGFPKPM